MKDKKNFSENENTINEILALILEIENAFVKSLVNVDPPNSLSLKYIQNQLLKIHNDITNIRFLFLKKEIEELRLSPHSTKALRYKYVSTIERLIQHSEDELLNFPNLGKIALKEIKEKLKYIGLSLKLNPTDIFPKKEKEKEK